MKKNISRKIINAILLFFLVVTCQISFTGCGSDLTIDLSKYVNAEFEGYDTIGSGKIYFDDEKFKQDYGDKIKISKSTVSTTLSKKLGRSDCDIFVSMLNGSCETNMNNLSNGDICTYKFSISSDLYDIFEGCKVENTEVSIPVSGLTNVETFDPFEGIYVEFFTKQNKRGARIVGAEENSSEIRYYLTKEKDKETYSTIIDGLMPGDTIYEKVKISYDRSYIEKYGKRPSVTEKEIKVTDFAGYPASVDEMDKQYLASLQNQGIKLSNEYAKLDSKLSNIKVEYVGNCYFTSKTGDKETRDLFYKSYNVLYLVYKITADVRVDNKLYGNNTFYYAFSVEDIEKDTDGKNSSEQDGLARVDGKSFQLDGFTYYDFIQGFESLDSLYENKINKFRDNFNIEDNLKK